MVSGIRYVFSLVAYEHGTLFTYNRGESIQIPGVLDAAGSRNRRTTAARHIPRIDRVITIGRGSETNQVAPAYLGLRTSRLLSAKGLSPASYYANTINRRNLDPLVSRLRSSKHAAAGPNSDSR